MGEFIWGGIAALVVAFFSVGFGARLSTKDKIWEKKFDAYQNSLESLGRIYFLHYLKYTKRIGIFKKTNKEIIDMVSLQAAQGAISMNDAIFLGDLIFDKESSVQLRKIQEQCDIYTGEFLEPFIKNDEIPTDEEMAIRSKKLCEILRRELPIFIKNGRDDLYDSSPINVMPFKNFFGFMGRKFKPGNF